MSYTKNCPVCGNEQHYNHRTSFWKAKKDNRICSRCSAIKRNKSYTEEEKKIINKKISLSTSGEKNGFFGKKHTDDAKQKIKSSRKLQTNLRKGPNNYQVWLAKYGKEEADRRFESWRSRVGCHGENHPCYGKPSPHGSGNGWKGWYGNFFFRSLRELTYIVNVIEKDNLNWISAETKKMSIKYVDWDGTQRTYRADFLVDNKFLVEIKPLKLHNSPNVLLKKKAAEEFCKLNGYIYIIQDPGILDKNTLKELYKNKKICFEKRYEEKFKDYFKGEL